MSNTSHKNVLLASLTGALTVAVVILAYMVLQSNAKIDALLADNRAAPAVSHTLQPKQSAVPGTPLGKLPDPQNFLGNSVDPDAWNPFSEMDDMQRRIDAMFNDAFGRFGQSSFFEGLPQGIGFAPRMDLLDEGDHFVVRLDVPGADKSKINVSLQKNTLTVEAEINAEREQTGKDHSVHRERRLGRFHRQVTLPGAVDGDSMKTDYKNGVLTITIDKAKKIQ